MNEAKHIPVAAHCDICGLPMPNRSRVPTEILAMLPVLCYRCGPGGIFKIGEARFASFSQGSSPDAQP